MKKEVAQEKAAPLTPAQRAERAKKETAAAPAKPTPPRSARGGAPPAAAAPAPPKDPNAIDWASYGLSREALGLGPDPNAKKEEPIAPAKGRGRR